MRKLVVLVLVMAMVTACTSKSDGIKPKDTGDEETIESTASTESEEEETVNNSVNENKTGATESTETEAMGDYSIPVDIQAQKGEVTYGELATIEYESTTVGVTRKAHVLLPPNYNSETAYPVLFLLHGIGGDQNEWLNAKPKEVIGNLIAEGEAEPMIVVIPNVRARVDDSANPSDIFTKEHFDAFDNFIHDLRDDLLPYIESHYAISDGRENRAIAGLSMGGRESIYIGLTMQETFGYIGAFSPAFGLLPYSNMNVTEDGLLNEEGFKLQDGYEDTFIMIANGDHDEVVWDEPFKYHQAFENNGVEHIYYEVPGGHDFTVWTNGLYHFTKDIFH